MNQLNIDQLVTDDTLGVRTVALEALAKLSEKWRDNGASAVGLKPSQVFVPTKLDPVFTRFFDHKRAGPWGRSMLRVVVNQKERDGLTDYFKEIGFPSVVHQTRPKQHSVRDGWIASMEGGRLVKTDTRSVGLLPGDEHAAYIDLDSIQKRGHEFALAVRRSSAEHERA